MHGRGVEDLANWRLPTSSAAMPALWPQASAGAGYGGEPARKVPRRDELVTIEVQVAEATWHFNLPQASLTSEFFEAKFNRWTGEAGNREARSSSSSGSNSNSNSTTITLPLPSFCTFKGVTLVWARLACPSAWPWTMWLQQTDRDLETLTTAVFLLDHLLFAAQSQEVAEAIAILKPAQLRPEIQSIVEEGKERLGLVSPCSRGARFKYYRGYHHANDERLRVLEKVEASLAYPLEDEAKQEALLEFGLTAFEAETYLTLRLLLRWLRKRLRLSPDSFSIDCWMAKAYACILKHAVPVDQAHIAECIGDAIESLRRPLPRRAFKIYEECLGKVWSETIAWKLLRFLKLFETLMSVDQAALWSKLQLHFAASSPEFQKRLLEGVPPKVRAKFVHGQIKQVHRDNLYLVLPILEHLSSDDITWLSHVGFAQVQR
mmetsp:Transcript_27504/g.59762  ORF Transcript_27504/g.59762 Transcript_27504/m.59762 type:complete len:433 (-) Transcript_27504:145-1443(-)